MLEHKSDQRKKSYGDLQSLGHSHVHAGDIVNNFVSAGQETRSDSAYASGYRNIHYLVPRAPVAAFTGRVDILRELQQRMFSGNDDTAQTRIALTGPGGTGKTQVCLKLIEKYRERYIPNVYPTLY